MSRARVRVWRPLAVWLSTSAAAAGAGATTPGAWDAAVTTVGPDRVADLLVACCATALTAALCWLWLITTATVVDLARGRTCTRTGGATRRLVLLACGAAVVAGSAVPAQATGGEGAELLVGLAMPERAVEPATTGTARRQADAYVVRAGDSLWSIARDHPDVDIDVDVDARWRAIWAANRAVVGDDPDLIHPGQTLRLPGGTAPTHDTDGAR